MACQQGEKVITVPSVDGCCQEPSCESCELPMDCPTQLPEPDCGSGGVAIITSVVDCCTNYICSKSFKLTSSNLIRHGPLSNIHLALIACNSTMCPPIAIPTCTNGQEVVSVPDTECCSAYECKCPDECPKDPNDDVDHTGMIAVVVNPEDCCPKVQYSEF